MNWFLVHDAFITQTGMAPAALGTLNASGCADFYTPDPNSWDLTINVTHYPWDIPQVRQAIDYVINKTEVARMWGVTFPVSEGTLFVPFTWPTLPKSLRDEMVNYTIDGNRTKAASILESLGFYKKNGDWYTPDGTELTLRIEAPSGYTDATIMYEDVANQLTAFGIPTTEAADPLGTYWGTIIPDVEYQAACDVDEGSAWSGLTAWAGTEGVWSWGYTSFNAMKVYKFPYPNGTIGEINLTQWDKELMASTLGTPEYWSLFYQYDAFTQYWMPTIPVYDEYMVTQYYPKVYNCSWMYDWGPLMEISLSGYSTSGNSDATFPSTKFS